MYNYLCQLELLLKDAMDWWLKPQTFLAVLEAGRTTVKELAESVPGEGALPCLQLAAFLPCPYVAKRSHLSRVSSDKGANPIAHS